MAKKKADSGADDNPKGDINFEYNQGTTGLNMDNIPSQIDKGSLTYALNAALENFDANSITYQNEPGTEFCVSFPDNYVLVGKHFIPEQNKQVFFLANPITGDSEIGYMVNNDCVYHTLINAKCLNFDINNPIQKSVHKTSNCGTEIYWAQPNEDRRYINLDPSKIPYIALPGSTPCDEKLSKQLDCNQLRVQATYTIPQIKIGGVISGGNLIAGAYQFAFQYSDAVGSPLSSYQSITNPTPIADPLITSVNFNYPVGKSIVVDISNIETGGQFDYFNLAVIKTINNITSAELVGTYAIEGDTQEITYSGQNVTQIRLSMTDIFEKFPFYGPADDVTTVQDVLVWKGVSSPLRVNYQSVASNIKLQWETWRIPPGENYANELNATNLRGYPRDEVFPFEIVFLLRSGKQTDGFHIPGRAKLPIDMPIILPTDDDFIEDPVKYANGAEYWRIYNTAINHGFSPDHIAGSGADYKGVYEYGEFAYWESDINYPCDEKIWGPLADTPIRHHKFPDVAISPIIEGKEFTDVASMSMGNVAIYPIGVRVDTAQVKIAIAQSDLTREQKDDIVGYKIVRGDRTDNKSVVAKGMLRNVGKYFRSGQEFYYPNYPYNDLRQDPFLNAFNNAVTGECKPYNINISQFNNIPEDGSPPYTEIEYIDCYSAAKTTKKYFTKGLQPDYILSVGKPTLVGPGKVNSVKYDIYAGIGGNNPIVLSDNTVLITSANYDVYYITSNNNDIGGGNATGYAFWYGTWNDIYLGQIEKPGYLIAPSNFYNISVEADSAIIGGPVNNKVTKLLKQVRVNSPLNSISISPELTYRQVFNSPETSFGQPFLGNVLKLESVMFGEGSAHFVEVKDNAKYRLISLEAQEDTRDKMVGNDGDSITAFFAGYEAMMQIIINSTPRKNFAYSFNSIADYNYTVPVPDGQQIKQRRIDLKRYLIPVVQNVGEQAISINNYERETSVYLRTEGSTTKPSDPLPLPFPHLSPNMQVGGKPLLEEYSRFTISEKENCPTPAKEEPIQVVSYYASLKNIFRGQWGQMYTYTTIDTGFQIDLDDPKPPTTVFGGDTFICRFAYKTKLPFFIDNRVGAPDDSDIFYDELGNVAYPKYWHTARSILKNATITPYGGFPSFFSYKDTRFDCKNSQAPVNPPTPDRNHYDGKFYLFAYGIPNFYVETSYNVDLRQAFNDREGEFWPHVSNSIPDNWVQESWVPIAQDNTYYYNVSFSKQNKENLFTHIPINFEFLPCETTYPFRAIYSDPQISTVDKTVNNWLTYRANAFFDFPQNYGKLTSIDGIDKGQLLARFENKSLLYNALYTTQTNTEAQVYLGQPLFTRQPPPYDYAETDLGYIGSQHKFLLKIPQGQVTVDAKRGQIFILHGTNVNELTAPGSGMNRFFCDNLPFQITRFFPDINIDNNFKDIGLHGVYDQKYDRIIITKLDYIPLSNDIKYDSELHEFYLEEDVPNPTTTTSSTTSGGSTSSTSSSSTTKALTTTSTTTFPAVTKVRRTVLLSDQNYFCNKSWTLSYSLITNSWLSFHSYLPNWYIGETNFFYSGTKSCCTDGFDFAFLVGELVPNPPTTTSTTTPRIPPPTTTTTSTTLSCVLVGNVVLPNCNLVGTGIIMSTPPGPCTRPSGGFTTSFGKGYTITSPPSTIDSTGSSTDACNAKLFILNNTTVNLTINSINVYSTNVTVGTIVYLVNGTNDCTVAPDGYYFTLNPSEPIIQVVSGAIASSTDCIPPTTTTTSSTTTCPVYLYDIQFYICGTCTATGPGTIANSQPLVEGKYYYDPVTKNKFKVTCAKGCGTVADRTILSSSAQDNCPAVVCPP